MSGKGHSLVCCCSIAFAFIPFSVHYLKGHRVRNKSLNCQFLICGRICRFGRLYAHIVCPGNKPCDVAAGSCCPTIVIRLLIFHCCRNTGELSIVVVCGCAVYCGCCCRCSRCRFGRRSRQCDRCISSRCSGNRDLRIAVACDRNSIHSFNAVVFRKVIAFVCRVNCIRHRSGQAGLGCVAGSLCFGHIAARCDSHAIGLSSFRNRHIVNHNPTRAKAFN